MTRHGVLCPLCNSICAPSYPLAMKHLSRVHAHSSGLSITCGINGCLSSYKSYTGWQKHIKNKHKAINNDILYNEGECFEEMEINDVYLQDTRPKLNENDEKKKQAAKWVLSLRDENKLTQATTEHILINITTFCAQLVNEIKEDIRVHFNEYQVSGDIVAKLLDKLDTDDYKKPFKGLEMKHQQPSFIQQHLGYVVSIKRYDKTMNTRVMCIYKAKVTPLVIYGLGGIHTHTHTLGH